MNPIPVTDQAAASAGAASAGAGSAPAGSTAAGSSPPAKPVPGRVAFVGTGPGDEGLLTLRAAALLGEADLVVASPEIAARFGHLIRPGAATAGSEALAQDPKLLVKAARAGQLVVRLYAGDPFLFCHAATEAAACAKAKVVIEVVPGMPSATTVPAYAGIPLTSDTNQDVRIIHASEVSRVQAGPGSLVILGAETGLPDLGKMLAAAGWKENTPLAITWNGTTTNQQTVVTTLGSVTADLKAAGISPLTAYGPAVAVVGDGIAAHRALSWFETKPLFGWRVLVPR
ncbi:MAG: SAM-dependent methyltransferase, partial [Actinomycetota bacterium]